MLAFSIHAFRTGETGRSMHAEIPVPSALRTEPGGSNGLQVHLQRPRRFSMSASGVRRDSDSAGKHHCHFSGAAVLFCRAG